MTYNIGVERTFSESDIVFAACMHLLDIDILNITNSYFSYNDALEWGVVFVLNAGMTIFDGVFLGPKWAFFFRGFERQNEHFLDVLNICFGGFWEKMSPKMSNFKRFWGENEHFLDVLRKNERQNEHFLEALSAKRAFFRDFGTKMSIFMGFFCFCFGTKMRIFWTF